MAGEALTAEPEDIFPWRNLGQTQHILDRDILAQLASAVLGKLVREMRGRGARIVCAQRPV